MVGRQRGARDSDPGDKGEAAKRQAGPARDHPAHWPDKVVFAALMVIIAGALAALFAILQVAQLTDITLGSNLPAVLTWMHPLATLTLGALMVDAGILGIRRQAAVWVWLGVAAGFASMGMLGIVPVLCAVALVFLLLSRLEGEETKDDGRILHPSLWPDKALAASLLLTVGAVVSIFQAGLLVGGSLAAPLLPKAPLLVAGVSLAAGLASLYAAHEAYHVRRPWVGYAACVALALGVGFWIVGPGLAIGAAVLLGRARAEGEFRLAQPA